MDRVVWPWQMSGNMGGMARDVSDDFPLTPEEALDSDEVRNDDGDEVVDPPEEWIDAKDNETLDERLAEEDAGRLADDDIERRATPTTRRRRRGSCRSSDDELDHIDPEQHGRERGQIDGTPEDGDSFYDVVE